ncbi:MAG: hypothetical protein QXJ07_03510 [Candidatus Bathyarchaeia archaeon]
MFQVTNDEYHVKVAHDLKEACTLLEAGFEYVTYMKGVKISENASRGLVCYL